MSNRKDNTVEKLDVESLIVDLLACGLGACIILFFIFSIKIIGKTAIQNNAPNQGKKQGSGSGYISLIGDNGNTKQQMGAVRVVEFSSLSADNYQTIKQYAASGYHDYWNNFSGFRTGDAYTVSLLNSLVTQVQVRNNNISFILTAGGIRELLFSFPEELKNKLSNSRDENAVVKVFAIEGQSRIGSFDGFYESVPYSIADIKNFKLRLRVGKARDIERLITIEGLK